MNIRSYETLSTLIKALTLKKYLYLFPLLIGLYHPLDGVTNAKYKLFHFLTNISLEREEGTNNLLG
jgi:hypothetical protein